MGKSVVKVAALGAILGSCLLQLWQRIEMAMLVLLTLVLGLLILFYCRLCRRHDRQTGNADGRQKSNRFKVGWVDRR
jgi:hypothetical protein